MGEDNIIDSIPFAEADLFTVSDEAGQYAENRDSGSSTKAMGKTDCVHPPPELGDVPSASTNVLFAQTQSFTTGFKRMHSTKIFNRPVESTHTEDDQAKSSVLQISTIPEGFNSGSFQLAVYPFSFRLVVPILPFDRSHILLSDQVQGPVQPAS
jgi:hypothetical protein